MFYLDSSYSKWHLKNVYKIVDVSFYIAMNMSIINFVGLLAQLNQKILSPNS